MQALYQYLEQFIYGIDRSTTCMLDIVCVCVCASYILPLSWNWKLLLAVKDIDMIILQSIKNRMMYTK